MKTRLKIRYFLIPAVIGLAACATTGGGGAVDQLNMGLGSDGVFGDPTPPEAQYATTRAGKGELIEPSYHTLPPEIPHISEKYLPITTDKNKCMDCHDKFDKIDQASAYGTGKKIPMPKSHYGGFTGSGVTDDVSGARYTCVQCHVQASDAQPLIDNTF